MTRASRVLAVSLPRRSFEKPHERVEEDDRVLEAALAGEANIILSGDKHLIRLRSWRGIRIQRPAEFLTDFDSQV